jgi:hypothetical protein
VPKIVSCSSSSPSSALIRMREEATRSVGEACNKVLHVMHRATQDLQSSKANAFNTIVSQLNETNHALPSKYREPMRVALLSRINNYYIVKDWMVVIAFFHPATKRNAVPEAILTVVADFVNEYGEATVPPSKGHEALASVTSWAISTRSR